MRQQFKSLAAPCCGGKLNRPLHRDPLEILSRHHRSPERNGFGLGGSGWPLELHREFPNPRPLLRPLALTRQQHALSSQQPGGFRHPGNLRGLGGIQHPQPARRGARPDHHRLDPDGIRLLRAFPEPAQFTEIRDHQVALIEIAPLNPRGLWAAGSRDPVQPFGFDLTIKGLERGLQRWVVAAGGDGVGEDRQRAALTRQGPQRLDLRQLHRIGRGGAAQPVNLKPIEPKCLRVIQLEYPAIVPLREDFPFAGIQRGPRFAVIVGRQQSPVLRITLGKIVGGREGILPYHLRHRPCRRSRWRTLGAPRLRDGQ